MRKTSRKFSCHPQSDQHKLKQVGEEVSYGEHRNPATLRFKGQGS